MATKLAVDLGNIRLVDRYLTFCIISVLLVRNLIKKQKDTKQRVSIQIGIAVYSRLFLAVITPNTSSVNLWSRFSEIEIKQ